MQHNFMDVMNVLGIHQLILWPQKIEVFHAEFWKQPRATFPSNISKWLLDAAKIEKLVGKVWEAG